MERDWIDFKAIHSNIAGAREAFADACETVFRKEFYDENVQQVAVKQGDGGIDIFVGHYGQQPIDVYQCKYFIDEIGKSQKQQISKSFKKAVISSEYKMKSWTLCVPRLFNQDELRWWSSWKGKMENMYGVDKNFIKLKNGNALIDLMKSNKVYNDIFDIENSKKIDEIFRIVKESSVDNCDYSISSKSEIDNLYKFFSQKTLNINNQLREDISKLFFELTQNAFDYGKAKSCFVEVENDKIILYEDGNSFNPFDREIKKFYGAGLLFAKIIKEKYSAIYDFEFVGKSGSQKNNAIVLKFKKSISDKNLIDRCYHFVHGVFLSRSSVENLTFDICEECDVMTFDLSHAMVAPSAILFFIDYLLKVTRLFKPAIHIKFSNNDTTKDFAQRVLASQYSVEIIKQITFI